MKDIDTFNRWLVTWREGTDDIRILAAPTAYESLSRDQAMTLAAYLLAAAGADWDRFGVILDAVLDA